MEKPDWVSQETLTGMMVVTGVGFVLLAVLGVGALFLIFVYEPEVKSAQDAAALVTWHLIQEGIKPYVPALFKTEGVIAFLFAQGLFITYWAYEHLGGKYSNYDDDITKWLSLALPVLLVQFIFAFGVMVLVTLYVIVEFIHATDPDKSKVAPWIFGGIGLSDLLFFGFIKLSLWIRVEIKRLKVGAVKN
jgi:hypothetical protein